MVLANQILYNFIIKILTYYLSDCSLVHQVIYTGKDTVQTVECRAFKIA